MTTPTSPQETSASTWSLSNPFSECGNLFFPSSSFDGEMIQEQHSMMASSSSSQEPEERSPQKLGEQASWKYRIQNAFSSTAIPESFSKTHQELRSRTRTEETVLMREHSFDEYADRFYDPNHDLYEYEDEEDDTEIVIRISLLDLEDEDDEDEDNASVSSFLEEEPATTPSQEISDRSFPTPTSTRTPTSLSWSNRLVSSLSFYYIAHEKACTSQATINVNAKHQKRVQGMEECKEPEDDDEEATVMLPPSSAE